VFADVLFAVSDILPGGQDDPAGEEYVPDRINDRNANVTACVSRIPPQFSLPHEEKEIQIEARFHRPRPVMIPLPADKPTAGEYYVRVREDNLPSLSQTLRLSLISRTSTAGGAQSETPCDPASGLPAVIVLDRDPFLVAQVRYPSFNAPSAQS